ncbi:MAG: VOC family protein [Magnetospiraceae bacterium]
MKPEIYLFFNGNCLEAMTGYAETLGGEVMFKARNDEVPNPADRMPGGDDLMMHMSIRIGDTLVMASDAPAERYLQPQGFSVSVAPNSQAEFDRIFAALAKDAKAVTMPPCETFWADCFTSFVDRYGVPWMLNFAGSKAAP